MLVTILITVALVALAIALLSWGIKVMRSQPDRITKVDWQHKSAELSNGPLLILASVGALIGAFYVFAQGTEKHNTELQAQHDEDQKQLKTERDNVTNANTQITSLTDQIASKDQALTTEKARTAGIEKKLADEELALNRAMQVARAAWLTVDSEISLTPAQKAEFDKLNQGLSELNKNLSRLQVQAVDRPKIEGRKAIAIFEVYQTSFSRDETLERGTGLFDFAFEKYAVMGDYDGRLSEIMRREIAPAVCGAAMQAFVQKIAPHDAIARMPRISGYDLSPDLREQLVDLAYVQTWFRLNAGEMWIAIRAYADDQKGPFQNKLGPTPETIPVHEIVTEGSLPETRLMFRQNTTELTLGTPSTAGATYGNSDLPNLRAAEAAKIIAALVDSCQVPGPNPSTTIKPPIEILKGRIYPEYREVDRRARVFIMAFLKDM